jgi:hypothetical protein
LRWSDCFEDNFSGEVAHESTLWCKSFSIRASRSKGCFMSVDRAIFEEGAPCLGTSLTLGIVLQFETSCYCIKFICFMYMLYSTFYFPHIYTSIPNWFSRGGFIQGHVDKKYLCSFSCMLVFKTTLFQL